MDRQKIKAEAKRIIKGNLGTILKPYGIILLIGIAVGLVTGVLGTDTVAGSIVSYAAEIAMLPLTFGYTVYLVKFVRNENPDTNELFNYYSKIVPIFLLLFLIGIFTTLWTLLLIIPGIIAAISYQQAILIMIDGEEEPMECIRKSKKMMYGYKMDYFIFMLSFFGWMLLSIVTFGLALIYVIPYINVSEILYYEELKKITK